MAAASADEVLDPDSKLARKKERDAALRSLNAIASAVGADTVALRANGNPLVESPPGMAERRLGTFGTRWNPLRNPLVKLPPGMAEGRLGTFGTRRNPLEPARNPARKSQHTFARCIRNKYRSQLGTRWNPLRNPLPEQQALRKINISPSIRSSNYNIIKRPDGLLQLPLPLAPPFLLEFYGGGSVDSPRRKRGVAVASAGA